jgi:hypothetical protein
MNTKTTVALVAVVAISAILVASILADDANARRCRHSGGSVHQTSAQACVQGSNSRNCQNINSQNAGNDIASNTIGVQTSNS